MFNYKLFLIDGLYFELIDTPEDKKYHILFLDNDKVIYETHLGRNMWAKSNRKYLSKYTIEIWDDGKCVKTIDFLEHIRGTRVFISFESKSLGDTIAWMPYCLQFKETYGCHVIVSTFLNDLFEKVYPELEFVGRGVVVNNIVAMIYVGWFWDKNMEPEHPATIPLQKSATNVLHLPFKEIVPRIHYIPKERPTDQKYIAISVRSTAHLKHWDYWQELVDNLNDQGYAVYEVSKDPCDLKNVIQEQDKSFENVMNIIHHAEFFIGLSSGISWLSWAMNKTVVMIANFTEGDHEFTTNCIRIRNTNVCNGCWNNPMFKFDKGNWWWCPEHEDTDRQFECHKTITAAMVIDEIKKAGI